MSLKKVIAAIRKNKSFLITSHINLEGDAIGSELGLMYLLKALKKKVTVINDDNLPYGFESLPGAKDILKYSNGLKKINYDCFIAVDCSDLARCGRVSKLIQPGKIVINIDHHISNDYFGNINLVEANASSCAEIIYKLFKGLRIPFNEKSALLIYVGILTDTGSFRYSNTSSFTHLAASDLLRCKLNAWGIYKKIYYNKPFNDLKFLAGLLATIKRAHNGKIAWAQLKNDILRDKELSFDLPEQILSFERSIKDVEVCLVFRQLFSKRPTVKVSFRSQGRVDVNKIAQAFGGGGHRNASGCIITGTLPKVRKKVLAKIREYLR